MSGIGGASGILRLGLLCFAVVAAAVLGCSGERRLPRSEQTVDGVTIYLGVVPAALVQGHSTTPGDPQALHGGTPPHAATHHVMVALFDAGTGVRITDARVRVSIGNGSAARSLEPMEVNGMLTYGDFFVLGGADVRRIHVEILLPGRPAPIEAEFAYEHEPGT